MNPPTVGPARRVWHWPGPPELEVLARSVRRPGGDEETWHLLQAQGGAVAAVCIAVHEERVLLGRAWRLPVSGTVWELARGFGEPGEDSVSTAVRELREETGLTAIEGRVVGSVYPDTGVLANQVDVVSLVVDDAPPGPSDGELTSWSWCSPAEVDHLVRTGQVVDGITLAALMLWRSGE